MHIVDAQKFKNILKNRGYDSIGEFAKLLKLHRNTIHYYLSGHRVLPQSFEKIINALNIKPYEILIEKSDDEKNPLNQIAEIIDVLHQEFPDATFILFGSRSRGTAQKYSDWDIGVYSKDGLVHELYRKIVMRKNTMIENTPILMDVVNFNYADDKFLKNVSRNWSFLSGKLTDWIDLQKRII